MYQLIISKQKNNFFNLNQERLQGIYPFRNSESSEITLCVRQGRSLFGYKYEKSTGTWLAFYKEKIFEAQSLNSLKRYPWFAADNFYGSDLILLRHPDGIRFYQINKTTGKLELVKEDGNFHDVYGQTLLFGSIYPNQDWIGMMARSATGGIKFYAATEDSLSPDESDPLFPLNTDLSITAGWHSPNTDFFLTKFRKEGPETIGVRSPSGIEFFQFNADYQLMRLFSTSRIIKPEASVEDRLFFVDLTNQDYQDILQLNQSGLFVHQYDMKQQDYRTLHHSYEFANAYGWLPSYSDSIKLFDLNSDGREDLLFTGSDGLTALTFDPAISAWETLLSPKQINIKQRYSNVVGTLPSIPQIISEPSMFIQDPQGKLQWVRVAKFEDQTNESRTLATLAPVKDIIPSATQQAPTSSNTEIPEQISRSTSAVKSILRWSEQWESNFMKEAVDSVTGQVKFNVPLVDTSTTASLGVQLALSYNSQATSAEVLGVGWSIPLATDYIVVDHKGSIYSEDAEYYLMTQGSRLKMNMSAIEGNIRRFQLAETKDKQSQVVIEYHLADQFWVIARGAEKAIYGKANLKPAEDAVQWSLTWPNWRGTGRNTEHLKPIINAWFLNARLDGDNQLLYHYESDMASITEGKSYTTGLRLKTISDNKQMRISFDYGVKTAAEYSVPKPIDEQGNVIFPVPLTKKHYLEKYHMTTAVYQQTIEFVYQISNGQRLLTGIQQQLPSDYSESMLQFEYKDFLKKPMLLSCTMPTGSTVNFSYEAISLPKTKGFNVLKYPIRETPKVAFGADYSIMAYRDLPINDKIILKIMNREMTKTLIDCTEYESDILCPSVSSAIIGYSLQAFQNSFMVIVESDQSQTLHRFDRFDKTWSTQPALPSFTKNTLIRWSETVLAVAEPNEKSLILFHRIGNQSEWKQTKQSVSEAITRLALHKELVIAYDDNNLFRFHLDSEHNWQKSTLASNLGSPHQNFARFDLTDESRTQVERMLNESGLQVLNNFILLNSIDENYGQLSSKIDLFLLDDQHNVGQHQAFEIQRESVLMLSYDLKQDASVFQLVYEEEEDIFKLKIKSISGDVAKHVEAIRNKNKRQDAMEEQIKQLSEAPGFRTHLRQRMIVNFQFYAAQISQNGVYCGDDILLQLTGDGWQRKEITSNKKIPLGQHLILELSSSNNNQLKIYAKNQEAKGQSLQELFVFAHFINRYPSYLAYQPTANSVEVLTFKDEKTLGETHTFENEQLLAESDWHNLITVSNASTATMLHGERYECLVRPLSSLISAEPQLFVNQLKLTDGDINRLTGFEHSFNSDIQELSYSETVAVIPGAQKSLSGWFEESLHYDVRSGNLTKTEKYFDASGKTVSSPLPKRDSNQRHNEASENIESLLLDQNGQLVICDFSPYKIADEQTAYFGFESYEINQIGTTLGNTYKAWRFNHSQVVKNRFAFTGDNYLQLEFGSNAKSSFIEGELKPRNQETTYIASCWIRSNTPLTLNTPLSNFKAVISMTSGQEIIGLLAQVKHQERDWSYLEVPIDFQVIKTIYRDYLASAKNSDPIEKFPSADDAVFTIKLRVEAGLGEQIDLDHIRFSPIDHDFQATVYQESTEKPTSVIQANGLVGRMLYDRYHAEIASLNVDGQLEYLTSTSRTGKVTLSHHEGLGDSKPCRWSFKPETGFYENFDAFALLNHWSLQKPDAWRIAPGQLWHEDSGRHRIVAKPNLFDSTSASIRFCFALQTPQSSLSLHWNGNKGFHITRQSDMFATLKLPNDQTITPLPLTGELIVMLEQNYVWLWLDGVLLVDEELPVRGAIDSFTPWSHFELEAQNKVLVEDLLVMNRPALEVEYSNAFNEKSQVIVLEDVNTVQVTETLYDSLGRGSITTKSSRIHRSPGNPLLSYRNYFVTNNNPSSHKSVWQTGQLKGEVDQMNPNDRGFAYERTLYAATPLNEESARGMPGREFSVTGPYAVKKNSFSGIVFLKNNFPENLGYRQKVEISPNGSQHIDIFDKQNNQVARYVRVPGFNHLLSTFEYDSDNRLVKIVPPLYHEKVDTASKLTHWQAGESHLTSEEKKWQQAMATYFSYDNNGNLVRKITPDSGTVEYLYDSLHRKRFMVALGANKETEQIVYYEYDTLGQLRRTGHFKKLVPVAALQELLETANLPNAEDYQLFDYTNSNIDPTLRGNIKHCITYNQEQPVAEALQFNSQQQIVSKNAIAVLGHSAMDQLTDLNKVYQAGRLSMLEYPIKVDGQLLRLVHHYNKLGQLVKLDIPGNPSLVTFTYNASGQLASEQYQPNTPHNFTRSYHYNSPGFMEKVTDPFLTEDLTYTDNGYGQTGYNDGMIMQTVFHANWMENADGRWFQIQENALSVNHSATCIKALKRGGYLTENGQPVKSYIRGADTTLPLLCGGATGREMAKLVAQKQIPLYYGHRYAYGNHQELVKAKYFTDETDSLIKPLQPNSFAQEISGVDSQQSQDIWILLKNAGYISSDQQHSDSSTATGKRGKSFFPHNELRLALAELDESFTPYAEPIERLILAAFSKKKIILLEDFKATFLSWHCAENTSSKLEHNEQEKNSEAIGRLLISKGYLESDTPLLETNFISLLSRYTDVLPEIVRVLSQHFAHALGETAFDVESYDIDANGNHRHFYTGFNRYELTYRGDTNQVQSIKLDWPSALKSQQTFSVEHDTQGNVVQALHKGIQRIEYHPVSQRTTRIELTNGRSLRFYYDAQGERILKQMLTAEGKVAHETHYLRDEQGRVLADRKIQYLSAPLLRKEIATAYLYGPRGMIGFIRNNNFYSVTTDHAGSIRLIIKAGEVVAAYDYMPYGDLMRSFGNDPEAHITYRFTGQEWDEETALYNYHARLYDPSIGRFYQPDPKSQYFSSYKYAGNSPVSLTDPDGREAITLIVLVSSALIGAYLGGAAANNRWNLLEWDYKDYNTYVAITAGALAGALAPGGFAASANLIGAAATVGMGIGGSYLMTAAANQNFNPMKWEWDRPNTWNAMFQGFTAGSNLVGAPKSQYESKWLIKLIKSDTARKGVVVAMGVGKIYAAGVWTSGAKAAFWEWDWSSATAWSSLLLKSFSKADEKLPSLDGLVSKMTDANKQTLKNILKSASHPMHSTLANSIMDHFMRNTRSNELDKTRSSLAVFSTYDGVLISVLFGKEMSAMLTLARNSKIEQTPLQLNDFSTSEDNLWMETWHSLMKKFVENLRGMQENMKNEAEQNLLASSSQIVKWQIEADQSLQKRREIFPDRSTRFLDCENTNNEKNSKTLIDSCVVQLKSGQKLNEKSQFQAAQSGTSERKIRKRRSAFTNFDELQPFHKDESDEFVFSGSKRLQFWPIEILKMAGKTFSSYFPSWSSASSVSPPSPLQIQSDYNQKPSVETSKGGPSLLEMGNYFCNNTDATGNLTWAVMIARKWSGYRPSVSNPLDDWNKEELLGIEADILVNEFVDSLLVHALACGIVTPVRQMLTDSKTLVSVTREVRKKLSLGDLEAISQLLCKRMVKESIGQISFLSTPKQANKLFERVTRDLSNFNKRIFKLEQEWILNRNGLRESGSLQAPIDPVNAVANMSSQVLTGSRLPEQLSYQPMNFNVELK